jgi:hypothetical protein
MAEFFTRIELHGGDSDDYDTLHAAMNDTGFYRAVRGHDGTTVRKLPTATYHTTAESGSCRDIRAQAQAASRKTGLKATILTVESADWAGTFP